ncbi:hypothetical protein CMI47_22380 [Candidatus Pacearchaeota archaeon]|nr:hypothetical protein [Candidatus Pacearchaeota archaeon]|tara:strand:+ start:596 stop:1903 length:1308 start_codon:yes stop_codon:yes gene_type:complete
MATKINVSAKYLVKTYKGYVPKSGFVIVEQDTNLNWRTMKELRSHAQRFKPKSFHITDIIPIPDKELAPIVWGAVPVKYKKNTLKYEGRQGTFKIEFSDNTIMLVTWYITGFGRNQTIESLIATESLVLYNFKKLMYKKRQYSAKPKAGFFKAFTGQFGLGYEKVDHPSLIETIHPAVVELNKDMDFFFNNVSIFTRYGMPGIRKSMLVGPPGTGKTSMCIKVAREYSKEYCVAVCTELEAAYMHLLKCAKYSVPTVVILEDAEAALSNTHSSVLNFLDGADTPANKKGAYVIMTTNHPERVEPRVLKRPGRIDRLYQVGPLEGHYALECAQLYFGKDLKYNKRNNIKLTAVVSGMTGAQIKELANSARAYCASNQLSMSIATINEVSTKLTKDLSEAYKFAEDNSLMIEGNKQKMGFEPPFHKNYDDNGDRLPF